MDNNKQSPIQGSNLQVNPQPKLRVEREHGGENVEEIDTTNLVSVNDAACPHTSWSIDPTETDFIAYTCDNPNCGIVKLFDK